MNNRSQAKRILILGLSLALAACAQPREVPVCTGIPFVLNAGLWQPGPDDLAAP